MKKNVRGMGDLGLERVQQSVDQLNETVGKVAVFLKIR